MPSRSHLAPQGHFSELHPDPDPSLLTIPSAPGKKLKPFWRCGNCQHLLPNYRFVCCWHFPSSATSAWLEGKSVFL